MSAQTAATTDPQTSTTNDEPTYSLALEEARRCPSEVFLTFGFNRQIPLTAL